MANMKRHIGKMRNTDQRIIVVMMQIAGREDHALVVATDSLPPRMESAIMELVMSNEGQGEVSIASLFHRRTLPDTGQNVLEALHTMRLLSPVPVDNVLMMPLPNMPFPLRTIIEQMGGSVPTANTPTPVPPEEEQNKYNPYGQIQESETTDDQRGIANNLLIEAELLEGEARSKREKAYKFAPELRPQELDVLPKEVEVIAEIKKTSRKKTKAPS